ncbi:hypothetical protein ACWDAZ_28420, partial [Streptomyces sp. NPDC001215]
MKAVATILRSGHRPDPTTLHHEALTRSLAETGRPLRGVVSPRPRVARAGDRTVRPLPPPPRAALGSRP